MLSIHIIFNICYFLIGCVLIFFGFKTLRKYFKIGNISTSKIGSLAAGEVELKGITKSLNNKVLTSPLSKKQCLAYSFQIQKTSKTKEKSKTETLVDIVTTIPFILEDDSGKIIVDPQKAKVVNDSYCIKRTDKIEKDWTEGLQLNIEDSFSFGTYTYEELIVPLNEKIYLLGQTVESPYENFPNRLFIKEVNGKDFLITNEVESQVRKRLSLSISTFFLSGSFLIFWSIVQLLNTLDWITYLGGF